MAQLLTGAEVVAALNERMTRQVQDLRARGIDPCLALLRVGEQEDDISYEKSIFKRCEKAGLTVRSIVLPQTVSQPDLLAQLARINEDQSIHGCLLFRPLPPQLDDAAIRAALAPRLDVDGVTDSSLTGVFVGIEQGFPPCTAQAVLEMLDHYGVELSGRRVTVIGRSLVVGKPLAMMLLSRNATVTVCHTRTVDLAARAQEADILIAAAGKAEMVDGSFVRPGQTVIDVGINFNAAGKLVGDVNFAETEPIVAAITPTPGGVGMVTASVLVKHTLTAAGKS